MEATEDDTSLYKRSWGLPLPPLHPQSLKSRVYRKFASKPREGRSGGWLDRESSPISTQKGLQAAAVCLEGSWGLLLKAACAAAVCT